MLSQAAEDQREALLTAIIVIIVCAVRRTEKTAILLEARF
jgi:hypothetical protein